MNVNYTTREMMEYRERDGESQREDWSSLMHNCWHRKDEGIAIEKCCA
jgi:hypothetical protein